MQQPGGHPERLPGGEDDVAKTRRVSRSERESERVGGDMGYRKTALGRGNSKCKGWEERERVAHSRNGSWSLDDRGKVGVFPLDPVGQQAALLPICLLLQLIPGPPGAAARPPLAQS